MGLIRGHIAQTVPKTVLTPVSTMTAGGTVQLTSSAFDLGADKKPSFLMALFPFVATLTSNKTATVTITIRHCDSSGGSYADLVAATAAGTDTAHGYRTTTGVGEVYNFADLRHAKRYIKVQVDAVFTATGTDTVVGPLVVILDGIRELPATNTAMLTTA